MNMYYVVNIDTRMVHWYGTSESEADEIQLVLDRHMVDTEVVKRKKRVARVGDFLVSYKTHRNRVKYFVIPYEAAVVRGSSLSLVRS